MMAFKNLAPRLIRQLGEVRRVCEAQSRRDDIIFTPIAKPEALPLIGRVEGLSQENISKATHLDEVLIPKGPGPAEGA